MESLRSLYIPSQDVKKEGVDWRLTYLKYFMGEVNENFHDGRSSPEKLISDGPALRLLSDHFLEVIRFNSRAFHVQTFFKHQFFENLYEFAKQQVLLCIQGKELTDIIKTVSGFKDLSYSALPLLLPFSNFIVNNLDETEPFFEILKSSCYSDLYLFSVLILINWLLQDSIRRRYAVFSFILKGKWVRYEDLSEFLNYILSVNNLGLLNSFMEFLETTGVDPVLFMFLKHCVSDLLMDDLFEDSIGYLSCALRKDTQSVAIRKLKKRQSMQKPEGREEEDFIGFPVEPSRKKMKRKKKMKRPRGLEDYNCENFDDLLVKLYSSTEKSSRFIAYAGTIMRPEDTVFYCMEGGLFVDRSVINVKFEVPVIRDDYFLRQPLPKSPDQSLTETVAQPLVALTSIGQNDRTFVNSREVKIGICPRDDLSCPQRATLMRSSALEDKEPEYLPFLNKLEEFIRLPFMRKCTGASCSPKYCDSMCNQPAVYSLCMILEIGSGKPLPEVQRQNCEALRKDFIDDRWANIAASALKSEKVARVVVPVVHSELLDWVEACIRKIGRKSDPLLTYDFSEFLKNFKQKLSTYPVMSEVREIINRVVDFTSRKVDFDEMDFPPDPDYESPRRQLKLEKPTDSLPKKKTKVERELGRLVNVSYIDENSSNPETCTNSFCLLGCVCQSLEGRVALNHCGQQSCIFGCQCKSKMETASIYKRTENLSRSEKTWHQTIICDKNEGITFVGATDRDKREKKIPARFQNHLFFGKGRILEKRKRDSLKAPEVPVAKKRKLSESTELLGISSESHSDIDDSLPTSPNREMELVICEGLIWCMEHNCYECSCRNYIVDLLENRLLWKPSGKRSTLSSSSKIKLFQEDHSCKPLAQLYDFEEHSSRTFGAPIDYARRNCSDIFLKKKKMESPGKNYPTLYKIKSYHKKAVDTYSVYKSIFQILPKEKAFLVRDPKTMVVANTKISFFTSFLSLYKITTVGVGLPLFNGICKWWVIEKSDQLKSLQVTAQSPPISSSMVLNFIRIAQYHNKNTFFPCKKRYHTCFGDRFGIYCFHKAPTIVAFGPYSPTESNSVAMWGIKDKNESGLQTSSELGENAIKGFWLYTQPSEPTLLTPTREKTVMRWNGLTVKTNITSYSGSSKDGSHENETGDSQGSESSSTTASKQLSVEPCVVNDSTFPVTPSTNDPSNKLAESSSTPLQAQTQIDTTDSDTPGSAEDAKKVFSRESDGESSSSSVIMQDPDIPTIVIDDDSSRSSGSDDEAIIEPFVDKNNEWTRVETSKEKSKAKYGLVCLVDELGYVPVTEFLPHRLSLCHPEDFTLQKSFDNLGAASSWLNDFLRERITFSPPSLTLEFFIATSSILKKKTIFDPSILTKDNLLTEFGLEKPSPPLEESDALTKLKRYSQLQISVVPKTSEKKLEDSMSGTSAVGASISPSAVINSTASLGPSNPAIRPKNLGANATSQSKADNHSTEFFSSSSPKKAPRYHRSDSPNLKKAQSHSATSSDARNLKIPYKRKKSTSLTRQNGRIVPISILGPGGAKIIPVTRIEGSPPIKSRTVPKETLPLCSIPGSSTSASVNPYVPVKPPTKRVHDVVDQHEPAKRIRTSLESVTRIPGMVKPSSSKREISVQKKLSPGSVTNIFITGKTGPPPGLKRITLTPSTSAQPPQTLIANGAKKKNPVPIAPMSPPVRILASPASLKSMSGENTFNLAQSLKTSDVPMRVLYKPSGEVPGTSSGFKVIRLTKNTPISNILSLNGARIVTMVGQKASVLAPKTNDK